MTLAYRQVLFAISVSLQRVSSQFLLFKTIFLNFIHQILNLCLQPSRCMPSLSPLEHLQDAMGQPPGHLFSQSLHPLYRGHPSCWLIPQLLWSSFKQFLIFSYQGLPFKANQKIYPCPYQLQRLPRETAFRTQLRTYFRRQVNPHRPSQRFCLIQIALHVPTYPYCS